MAGEGFVILIGVASFLVFAVVLPLWTYSDAQRNSEQSALLWALVVFFGGILGILLYLVIGRESRGGGRRGGPSRY